MANNRLYLVDDATGDAILIAKGFSTWGGWSPGLDLIWSFLLAHDFDGAQGGKSTLRLATDDDERVATLAFEGKLWKPPGTGDTE